MSHLNSIAARFRSTVAYRRSCRLLRLGEFRDPMDERGATAIEFGIIAIPFCMLMFGIVELALVFFTGAVLTHAVSDAGRTLRVGAFQGCGKQDEFKNLVCHNMTNMMGCHKNLRIDVESADKFKTVAFNDPTPPDGTQPDPQVSNGEWDDTVAGDPVVIRATFYYPLILPPTLTRLETEPGSGRRVLIANTAFRNEPFPASTTCDEKVKKILDGASGTGGT